MVSSGAVTKRVDRLAARGLVERRPSASDGRSPHRRPHPPRAAGSSTPRWTTTSSTRPACWPVSTPTSVPRWPTCSAGWRRRSACDATVRLLRHTGARAGPDRPGEGVGLPIESETWPSAKSSSPTGVRSRYASPAPARTTASRPSPSTPSRTATHSTSRSPTRRTPSAASTPGDSYLLQDKLIEIAHQAGADAVHPGYGFLAENGGFAQKVIDSGLVWIGPGPEAIDSLGDKVKARHIALAAKAPLVPGTADPVEGPDEVVAFAKEFGLPGRHQGGLRRRRSWPEGRPHPRGDPRAVRVRGARGRHGVRPRRVLRRALPRPPAPRRDPVPGRPARQRRRRLHPRLLAAAPQPEARRGGPGPLHHRRAAHRAAAGLQGDPARGRLRRRRHLRVPRRPPGRHLLPRGQHPPAGRAPGVRGGHRHRPRARAVPHRRRRVARLPRPRAARPLHRVPDQRRGCRPRLPARPRHRHDHARPPGPRASAGTPASSRATPSPARSTR